MEGHVHSLSITLTPIYANFMDNTQTNDEVTATSWFTQYCQLIIATMIRQRRQGGSKRNADNNGDDEHYDAFAEQYNAVISNTLSSSRKSSNTSHTATLGILFTIGIAVLLLLFASPLLKGTSSADDRNLKLITVYPRSVSERIHTSEGQTELLVTDDNRDVVDVIRTTIGMINNLKRNRRKKGGIMGIVLGMVNFISSLGKPAENSQTGEVLVEAYDVLKMRQYLLKYGNQCLGDSGAENNILQRYDELVSSLKSTDEYDKKIGDASWNKVVQLFAWCQFANGDARGYVSHGLKGTGLQQHLENARLNGVGISAKQSTGSGEVNEVQYTPLFVMPAWNDDGSFRISNSIAKEILQSHLESTPTPKEEFRPLLFEIRDVDLQLAKERHGEWIFLTATTKKRVNASDSR